MHQETCKAQQGTFRYMAQEQLDCLLTSKIDIWALGCIMLQFVSGDEPYAGVDNELAVAHELCEARSPM
jgi:serine/threonine protein kinase